MIRQGELLAGKYRVEQVLGAGGMGYVVAALHEQLNQRVAVKLLVPQLCENEESVTRFLREARAAVRIQSEHVARVLDVGELTNGAPYMVMEFLSGHDLAEELDLPGQLEPSQAIDYVLQAAEAVAEAHSLGVIHRDLKPANLFLTRRPDGSPFVKVLDFGISKAIATEDNPLEPGPSLTATHSLLGSPAYMSPEQIRRPKSVDTRTDIWSLGSILYELLAREAPFQADTPMGLLAAVVSDPLPSLRDKRPDVAPELESIIAKCLEKNPANRYQTVAELAEALVPFADRTSLPSVTRISGILRSSSQRPSADKSVSSDATMRSVGSGAGSAISEQDTEVQVEVIAPLGKSTHTGWEALPASIGRTRRRAVALTASALVAAVVLLAGGVAWWLRPNVQATAERAAASSLEPSPPLAESARAAVAEKPAVTVAAPQPPGALPLPPSSAVAPAPVVAAPAPKPKAGAVAARPAAPARAPAAVAAPPEPAAAAKAAADPLDGRR